MAHLNTEGANSPHIELETSNPERDAVNIQASSGAAPQVRETDNIDPKGLWFLSALHFSSAWGDRSSAFAIYLFLVTVFPSTLLPASVYGFCVTGCGIVLSSTVGSLVDKYGRLTVIQTATVTQKVGAAISYSIFLAFFLTDLGREPRHLRGKPLFAFIGIVLSGALTKISTICLNLSIERDWASTIGRGSSRRLTKLNTWLRRIDLACDLVSPSFVSGLTAGVSYPFATAFLCGMTVTALVFEIVLSRFAYLAFPELALRRTSPPEQRDVWSSPSTSHQLFRRVMKRLDARDTLRDFREFQALPVFYSSLSIASIYLTVLSFDGTMLTFLKDSRNYSDPFIAGQRALCTATGLMGTLLFPIVSRKLGVVRTGSWSIWSEFMCLIPVVVTLNIGKASNTPTSVPAWNAALLFGGMASSRIFLWMFDLAQLQILQESLEAHPRRNRLASIQYTLQNVFDMAKYALTIGLADPSQFRWAGLASVLAVLVGAVLYVFGYARRVRGHLAPHWRWLVKFKLI